MKAFVLAGGIPQCELIKQLKKRNIIIVLGDGSENPVAKPYADFFYKVNIFDIEAVKQIAINEEVDFLITVCADQVLLVVAQVSEELNLPCYIDYETARNVSDKIRMKQILVDNDIPTSRFIQLDKLDMVAIKELNLPLVIKPVDAYSSKGVRKITSYEEIPQYYEDAAKISRTGGVIIEEYCEGDELSVDAFIKDGKATVLAVTRSEKIRDKNRFVIHRGIYPAIISHDLMKEIEVVAQQITDAFKLRNAPLLIQLITKGKSVSVLEFCARTGGNMKWLLIKYSAGVDVIAATSELFLKKVPEIERKETGFKYVINDFLYSSPCTFDHLEGFEELKSQGIINLFFATKQKGAVITGAFSSSDRIVGINILAKDKHELLQKYDIIRKTVKIIDSEGKDTLRHDLMSDMIVDDWK